MDMPEHLKSTVDMLNRAYPAGIPENEYRALLTILYEHMSNRSLTNVIVILRGSNWGTAYNDVLAAGAAPSPAAETQPVLEKLRRVGFDSWLDEP